MSCGDAIASGCQKSKLAVNSAAVHADILRPTALLQFRLPADLRQANGTEIIWRRNTSFASVRLLAPPSTPESFLANC